MNTVMRNTEFVLIVIPALIAGKTQAAEPLSITSPNGQVRIEFSLRKTGNVDSAPHYRVMFGDKEIVGYSRLGIESIDGSALGGACEIYGSESSELREQYTQSTGKRRDVKSHSKELLVLLRELASRRRWHVEVRAFDDGVAFRYHFPAQDGWNELAIKQERTEFCVPPEAKAFALPLNGFTTSHEKRYQTMPVRELPKDWLLGLPLLLECPGGTWAALTEANIDEYAGCYFSPTENGCVTTRLSPLLNEPGIAVRAKLPHASPWRVIMLGDKVGRLVESDIIHNLSDPCAIDDPSWITTGKTTFPWWNGFYEERVPFRPGLNTATAKYYIDFCAEAGIPYHSLDGINDTAWYSGPIHPYAGADITKALPEIDLAEVLRYAESKGVKLRLWMNWKGAEAHMERAFPIYRDWGIQGVMLDFMDRDDQEMNRFIRKAVKLAADNRLTVTLHGCPKPTGLERTYPNLLSHEGVLNLEYDKWDEQGITPEHELTVVFTRMLAGPMDFHQGSFRTVTQAAFKPRNDAPLVIGTPARTLASYVVYQNHLSMVADYPSAYRGHPGLPYLASIPTTWDDTKVIDAKVGQYIVIARRSGPTWYLGAMTDRMEHALDAPLGFLSTGAFEAEVVTDQDAENHKLSIVKQSVSSNDTIKLKLVPAGGALVRITAKPASSR